MELIDRQIEAVRETIEVVRREWEEGRLEHCWSFSVCPLCNEFKDSKERYSADCGQECPFKKFADEDTYGCAKFFRAYITKFYHVGDVPISYVWSLLIDLEDALVRMKETKID